jgi:Tfp pilus assembly protein PilF
MNLSFRYTPTLLVSAAVVCSMAGPVAAQAWRGRGRLEGKVQAQDGKPVEGAVVKFTSAKSGPNGPEVKADKGGRWTYLGLGSGEWTVTIEAPGYIPGKIVVKVSENERAQPINWTLEPAPVAAAAGAATTGLPPEIVEAVKVGNEALEQKRYKEAREAFEKVSAAQPDNTTLWFALSRAYYAEGNVEKSVAALRKEIDKEPANETAWLLTANMLLEKGDLEGGHAALEKVPPASITDPSVYINVGVLYLNKKKAAEAEDFFGKAIALSPDKGDGYYYRGLSRVAGNKPAEAKADFQKFLSLSPNAPEATEVKQLLEAMK